MVEFSRGRGTDLSHPLSSGLTNYILFIIRDYSKSTATLVYCSFKSPRRGFFDKINKKSGRVDHALLKYALPQIILLVSLNYTSTFIILDHTDTVI